MYLTRRSFLKGAIASVSAVAVPAIAAPVTAPTHLYTGKKKYFEDNIIRHLGGDYDGDVLSVLAQEDDVYLFRHPTLSRDRVVKVTKTDESLTQAILRMKHTGELKATLDDDKLDTIPEEHVGYFIILDQYGAHRDA